MIIVVFAFSVFVSHINSVLYNLKIDMYALNRSAIIAVNKGKTSIDDFSYDLKTYKKEFVSGLKQNYSLNESLENNEKRISKIEILEYEILEEDKKDSYTNKRCDSRVLHTVIEVKIRPIVFVKFFEEIFVFTIHEDVALNSLKTMR